MASETASSLDVAGLAGAGQPAVGRAVVPGVSVSQRTAELGCRPDALARSLTAGRARIIGLVVSYLKNYFCPEAVERLSVALRERGCHVLLLMGTPAVGEVDGVMQEILDDQASGVALAFVSMPVVERWRASGIPVVLFDRAGTTRAGRA